MDSYIRFINKYGAVIIITGGNDKGRTDVVSLTVSCFRNNALGELLSDSPLLEIDNTMMLETEYQFQEEYLWDSGSLSISNVDLTVSTSGSAATFLQKLYSAMGEVSEATDYNFVGSGEFFGMPSFYEEEGGTILSSGGSLLLIDGKLITVGVAGTPNILPLPRYTGEMYFGFDAPSQTITSYDSGASIDYSDVLIPPTIDNVAVKHIGDSVFASLATSAVLPDGLLSIGPHAFENSNLTELAIPNTVTSIGESSFLRVPISSLTIPNSVITIEGLAFAWNISLTNLVIGNHVASIGYSAFEENFSLETVSIPGNVTSIGDRAFCNVPLTTLTLGEGIISIGDSAFARLPTFMHPYDPPAESLSILNVLVIPNSVTSIGQAAFKQAGIVSLTIGSGLESISNDCFRNNSLTSVTIPSNITSIGHQAFYENQLTSIVIPNSVTEINSSAFAYNDISSITLPNGLTTLEYGVLRSNNLVTIDIPDSVTAIGYEALVDNLLSSIDLNNVINIGGHAFGNNPITSITIGANVVIENSSAPSAMGTYGDAFVSTYNGNGRLAGIYTYNTGVWTKN